ncbi:DUF2391 family protein [Halobellus marinus]|uniref:DUF2391 family protein n=1 Tax=Halobellus TaxID=1073986 RepID=UPI0028B10413|nr:DUF2391 family protein [Halobellus sp. DFY28]
MSDDGRAADTPPVRSEGEDEFPLDEEDEEFPLDGEDEEFPLDGEDEEFPLDEEDEELRQLLAEFDTLANTVDSPEEREQVRAARNAAVVAAQDDDEIFGQVIRGYDRADLAEALLGSLLFGIPMFVEGGTNEVGEFLAARPPLLAGTVVGAVGLIIGILYVAEIQDVRVYKPILGIVPRRLVGVLCVSFVTAVVMMTAWGRVEWSSPLLALATVVVAFVPMSVGAALGDILPGS